MAEPITSQPEISKTAGSSVTGPWVYFFGGKTLPESAASGEGREDHYEVRSVVPVCGQNPVRIDSGSHLVRIETGSPLSSEPSMKAEWRGMVRHLQYTTQELRQELQERSAKECLSERTMAVLIPIRKSAEWWALAQDERQRHFCKPAARENHSTIGHRYADRIYRRLYHCRYLEPLPEYDFLTYFEFPEDDTEIFKELLKNLRDLNMNPEWKFVDREVEIWMSKGERRSVL